MVFSTPERNPWGAIPISIIRMRAQLPPPQPGQPGPFSLGAEGVLSQALQQAGFKGIETYPVSAHCAWLPRRRALLLPARPLALLTR
jgi:hypothetical protein